MKCLVKMAIFCRVCVCVRVHVYACVYEYMKLCILYMHVCESVPGPLCVLTAQCLLNKLHLTCVFNIFRH